MSQPLPSGNDVPERIQPPDMEKGVAATPTLHVDMVSPSKPQAAIQASGDRALVLMDLDNGLVY